MSEFDSFTVASTIGLNFTLKSASHKLVRDYNDWANLV